MNGSSRFARGAATSGCLLVWLAILGAALFLTRRPASQPIEIVPPPTPLPSPTPAAQPDARPAAGRCCRRGAGARGVRAAAGQHRRRCHRGCRRPRRRCRPQSRQQGGARTGWHAGLRAPSSRNPTPATVESGSSRVDPAAPMPGATGESGNPARRVNLNTATLAELDTLPGVGPATAQRIIDGRPYSTIEDLMRVKGIGQATFDKLKDTITVK